MSMLRTVLVENPVRSTSNATGEPDIQHIGADMCKLFPERSLDPIDIELNQP